MALPKVNNNGTVYNSINQADTAWVLVRINFITLINILFGNVFILY